MLARTMAGATPALLLLLLAACAASAQGEISQPGEVHLAAFNVQVFGLSKMEKSGVPEVLADVLRRYDIVLFQEIRDSSQTAIFELVDLLNEEAPGDYSVSVSERLGRTSSKEQYAFVYRVGKVALISAGLYSDPGDVFEREPYFATFRTQADFEFTLVGLHSKPDDAVAELNRMGAVRDHVADLTGNDNIVLLGDFNAGTRITY
eukprot:TRINITY_DN4398_c0_g1_i2.p1 TRINITY_DN4398_c0_g1~~TRINITY_DN4398_c0_g1_i2.p1  ORF type:complete len:214 (-),score=74.51 TRINITY_DN4398_c0_g1_i2:173-787(-)